MYKVNLRRELIKYIKEVKGNISLVKKKAEV
jgi:hypothetical protein